MIQMLARKIPHWYSMDSFREEDLAFLVGLKSDQLSSVTNFIKHALELLMKQSTHSNSDLRSIDHIAIQSDEPMVLAKWYESEFGAEVLYLDETWALAV